MGRNELDRLSRVGPIQPTPAPANAVEPETFVQAEQTGTQQAWAAFLSAYSQLPNDPYVGIAGAALTLLQATGRSELPSVAANLLPPLARSGDRIAQYYLGVVYADGIGVQADDFQAFFWFKRSADKGYLPAQHQVAVAYRTGAGVLQDDQ